MKKITIQTSCRKMLADVYTPVGIYLRLRDKFRDTILLESTDYHSSQDSWSFICIHAIGGVEISSPESMETKLPGRKPERAALPAGTDLPALLAGYMNHYDIIPGENPEEKFAQGLYGYTSWDAIPFFEPTVRVSHAPSADSIRSNKPTSAEASAGKPTSAEASAGKPTSAMASAGKQAAGSQQPAASLTLPLLRYRLYQYIIAINHHRDELFLLENRIAGLDSEADAVESLIRNRDVPLYPFRATGAEESNMSDEEYRGLVRRGIASCYRGDVFQIVLSRRFARGFTGDEFNVYRALRSVNPSPYLFFFDYGDYKLMGSSPEAQLKVQGGMATVHPIAGTFRRTGDAAADSAAAGQLLQDAKENAEHVMLVDLARNDLSRHCADVQVSRYREVQFFSHVIHLVSEVTGRLNEGTHPFSLLAASFPAGTLSGAPKVRAMQLIGSWEPTARGFYGGAIGFMGFDGSCQHAIMIRTFLSRQNTLFCQAGAGVVAASDPERELQEVNNKLGALRKAVKLAEEIGLGSR